MKKKWFLVPLLVLTLAIGITGGAVLAQGNGAGSDSPFKSFTSRVAAILGLDETQVQDAFKQAAREMEDEALQSKLDQQVKKGRITQEQADEYKDWYQSRPEALSPGFPGRGFNGHKFLRGRMRGGHGWHGMKFRKGDAPTPETSGTSSL